MPKFRVVNAVQGVTLGLYEAQSHAEALNIWARYYGYADYADAYRSADLKYLQVVVVEVPENPTQEHPDVKTARARLEKAKEAELDATRQAKKAMDTWASCARKVGEAHFVLAELAKKFPSPPPPNPAQTQEQAHDQ